MTTRTRRLVGIDLGIASAHTVRVLDETGQTIAKRKAWPTVASLTDVETTALAGTPEGTRLEVIVEPTGPAWLPIAVFFTRRGHLVHRVSSAKAADLRRFLSRHTKTNGIDADTLARLPLFDPAGLQPLVLPGAEQAALDRRVRATDRLTRAGAEHKRRIKDLARQLLPMIAADRRAWGRRPGRAGTLRRPEHPAPVGIQAAHRTDRQGLPRPPRQRPGAAVGRRRPSLAGPLRRPPRGRVRRSGRRDRHRGPAAARHPSRARRPCRAPRDPLPAGRPRRAGPQPARRRRHRRPRPGRRDRRPHPVPHRQGVPRLHRSDAQGLRDRRHRPQGPADVEGRLLACCAPP